MAKEKNHWSYENEDIPNCEIIAISSPPSPPPHENLTQQNLRFSGGGLNFSKKVIVPMSHFFK